MLKTQWRLNYKIWNIQHSAVLGHLFGLFIQDILRSEMSNELLIGKGS
jgi:hypothetical protein